jgi:hypothetical protein
LIKEVIKERNRLVMVFVISFWSYGIKPTYYVRWLIGTLIVLDKENVKKQKR